MVAFNVSSRGDSPSTNESLVRIRSFIKMYDKQETVGVASVDGKHVVVNDFGTDNEITYVCRTLTDAAHCVNCIIFDMPIKAA